MNRSYADFKEDNIIKQQIHQLLYFLIFHWFHFFVLFIILLLTFLGIFENYEIISERM